MYALDDLPANLAGRLLEHEFHGPHWIWTSPSSDGYGRVRAAYPHDPDRRPEKRPVHLVVYEHLVGPVPVGLELDHMCVYRACAWPGCVEPVSHAENQRRAGFRLTHCRRASHPRSPENTYVDPTTGRARCRPCAAERERGRPLRARRRAT